LTWRVQPRLRAVIQEKPNSQLPAHPRAARRKHSKYPGSFERAQRLLDQADPFHRLDRAADIILIACRARKNQRIENDVLRPQPVFFRQQLVRRCAIASLRSRVNACRLELVFIDAASPPPPRQTHAQSHDAFEFFARHRSRLIELMIALPWQYVSASSIAVGSVVSIITVPSLSN